MLYNPKWEGDNGLTPCQRLLLAAADLVERRGLAKHIQEDGRGRVCLHGAISIASAGRPYFYGADTYAAERRVMLYLNAMGVAGDLAFDRGVIDCSGWNNQPARTKDEVAATLRAAAFSAMAPV